MATGNGAPLTGFPVATIESRITAVLQDVWQKGQALGAQASFTSTILYFDIAGQQASTSVNYDLTDTVPFGSVDPAAIAELSELLCDYVTFTSEAGDDQITITALNLVQPHLYFGVSDENFDPVAAVSAGTITVEAFNSFAVLAGTLVLDENAGGPQTVSYTLSAPAASGVPGDASDFDGNGYDDILFFNDANNAVGRFEMPSGDWSSLGTAGANWEVRGLGLFDNDDTSLDILWYNTATRAVGRFDMENGGFAGWGGLGKAGVGWEVGTAGDFNGDGVDDILWINESAGKVGQFRVSGAGNVEWRGVGSVGSGWEFFDAADLNDDGIDDLLWVNAASGAIGQFRMSASGKSWVPVANLGSGFAAVDTGDFDGDGYEDVLVANTASRSFGFFDMDGGTASWVGLGGYGAGWTIVGTGDFDGSGTDDILWRHDDGRVGQHQMDGATRIWDDIGFAGSAWDVLI